MSAGGRDPLPGLRLVLSARCPRCGSLVGQVVRDPFEVTYWSSWERGQRRTDPVERLPGESQAGHILREGERLSGQGYGIVLARGDSPEDVAEVTGRCPRHGRVILGTDVLRRAERTGLTSLTLPIR